MGDKPDRSEDDLDLDHEAEDTEELAAPLTGEEMLRLDPGSAGGT